MGAPEHVGVFDMVVNRALGRLLAVLMLVGMPAEHALADLEEEEPAKTWEELKVQLPAPPKEKELLGFYVSPTTENKFFIDPGSVSVGSDGVVRYTLVVVSGTGVRNVSFEGMRCETRERRSYAFGRPDGGWSKARGDQWEKVRAVVSNRHHAALFLEYFCPGGVIVGDAKEAVDALRRGGHPAVAR